MNSKIHIVDLFSGPGGLGEGFCNFSHELSRLKYQLEVSIERDTAAHKTLLLRAFLRQFRTLPTKYYEWLPEGSEVPDWSSLYPSEWQAAVEEAWHSELGKSETARALTVRIEKITKVSGARTLLIGGPPCQAYSLVGRARNVGVRGYVPGEDQRHFLYKEYCRVLSEFSPSVFVMENVKGMLSSSVGEMRIFDAVLNDLETAGEGYQLYGLASAGQFSVRPNPKDFILRSEEFGVPQARHRVIIVGVKRSIASRLPSELTPVLSKQTKNARVRDVLRGMLRLRSGLSRADDRQQWYNCPSSYKMGHQSGLSIGGSGSFV